MARIDPSSSHSLSSLALRSVCQRGSAVWWKYTENLKVRRVKVVSQTPLHAAWWALWARGGSAALCSRYFNNGPFDNHP